ncbi:triphosphoribosyl-dephospho-CoA synthase [Pseudoduganella sp. LjRoot289]|uniref:triphosphoribosyl-dephospho-CoA synthase n=1 Tax=Pseudoduganella sp. LjRoot289 TaxID=3342314 RepID=UPI003ECCC03E
MSICRVAAQLAVRALYAELTLYPKPGLVSLVDTGSHDDMDAATFMRSLFSLRHYFADICKAGLEEAPFARLKQLGVAAEARMMAATQGINTHRGAIFSLGLLCAALGRHFSGRASAAYARRGAMPAIRSFAGAGGLPGHLPAKIDPRSLRKALTENWGSALAAHARAAAAAAGACASHGRRAAALHAATGAREEGALGLPSVFDVGLPALQGTLSRGGSMADARIDALFALMAHVSDTNVLHRGGAAGAQMVREHAQRFVALGGTRHPAWREHALECHRLFVTQKLSPGGAADLLSATCLVHAFATHAWP